MEKGKKNTKLIKGLFKNELKREELEALTEIDIVKQRMEEQWEECAEKIDSTIGEQIWTNILKKYKTGGQRRFLFQVRRPLIAACISLFLIISGYFVLQGTRILEKPEFLEVVAKNNMLYILPDSSKVWMRPQSSIRFAKDFTKDRNVWLKGSSLFEVRKQSGSKFHVYIDKAFIEVKGTRFLVEKQEDGKDEITLFNGSVMFKVESTGEQVEMQPLQQVLYDSSDSEIQMRNIENIEWQDGKFKFNAMPLNQLLHVISQIYNVQIVFEGKGDNPSFSGTIRQDESLRHVIDKICFIMNLHEARDGDRIIITN